MSYYRWRVIAVLAAAALAAVAAAGEVLKPPAVKARVVLWRGETPGVIVSTHLQTSAQGVWLYRGVDPEDGDELFPAAEDTTSTRARALKAKTADLTLGRSQQLNLYWPDGLPRDYLEENEAGTFRRVQLADKEGYKVVLRAVKDIDRVKVEVTAEHLRLTGATFDDRAKAYIGCPTLERTRCTVAATVAPGSASVLLWKLPTEGEAQPNDIPHLGLVLASGEAATFDELPFGPAAEGVDGVLMEVGVELCEVPAGSEAADELAGLEDKAPALRRLVDDGTVKLLNHPNTVLRNGTHGEVTHSAKVPYLTWDEARQEKRVEWQPVTNSLGIAPRILADGDIQLGLELGLEQLTGFVEGPKGEAVPIMAHQSLMTYLHARNGRPVAIAGLSQGGTAGGPMEIMALVTATVLNPAALPEELQVAIGVAPGQAGDPVMLECIGNMKLLCAAARMHAQDSGGVLPGSLWPEDLAPYHGSNEPCPHAPAAEWGYLLNALLPGVKLADIPNPAEVVLFFEGDANGEKPIGRATSVVDPPRHGEMVVAGFVDGHAKALPAQEVRELLRQDPLR